MIMNVNFRHLGKNSNKKLIKTIKNITSIKKFDLKL